jgi:hypothetical protein
MMPSQPKSSSSRRGGDKPTKKKAVFNQAFLEAVSESDTDELQSVSDTVPRQNLVSPDMSEMTALSSNPATRTNTSPDLLTADDGAPGSLQPAPGPMVPVNVPTSLITVPSDVITVSRTNSDSNTTNPGQEMRPSHAQVTNPSQPVSSDGNPTNVPMTGPGTTL